MEYVTLSNGVKMPIMGYGVYQVTKDECERCVLDALKAGYRSLDTAQSYFNEEEVGSAIQKSGLQREEIFLTTKVWVEHYGYDACRKSVEESLKKLKTDYLDLLLLHQPFSDYYGAWHALEDLYKEGTVRAIGVSNFYPDRLVDIASFANIRPMVNQVETHPHNQQIEAKKWMDKYNIQIEAWAPFGEGRGGLFEEPVLKEIGAKYAVISAASQFAIAYVVAFAVRACMIYELLLTIAIVAVIIVLTVRGIIKFSGRCRNCASCGKCK